MSHEAKKAQETAAKNMENSLEFAKGASVAEQGKTDEETEKAEISRAQKAMRKSQRAQMLARNDKEVYDAETTRKSEASIDRSNASVLRSKREMDDLQKRKMASERDSFLDQQEQFRRQRAREVRFESAHDAAERESTVNGLRNRAQEEAKDRRKLRENFDRFMCEQIEGKNQQEEEKKKQSVLELENRQGYGWYAYNDAKMSNSRYLPVF